jgi:hypothetical protein
MSPVLIRAAGLAAMLSLAGLAGSAAASAGTAASPPQRQLAVTTLSNFEVVLTATRSPGTGAAPAATVTASGYRHAAGGWRLIGTDRIGKANGWSWYATQVCGLKVTQFKPEPSSAKNSDTMTVRLLWGPAIGCLGPYSERWHP